MVKTQGLARPDAVDGAITPRCSTAIAEITMELESIGAHLESVAVDWSEGVDHGGNWPIKIVAAKHKAVDGAWRVVDQAMDLSGGFGMFKKSELERLFRDARAGRFHPANLGAVARARRQADARDQSGRAAAVGVSTRPWFVARARSS